MMRFNSNSTVIDIDHKNTFFSRLRGLMFRRELAEDHAILLDPADRVHSHFMIMTIDVIYLDKDNIVLDFEELKPWKLGKKVEGTRRILEGAVGLSSHFKVGGKLVFEKID